MSKPSIIFPFAYCLLCTLPPPFQGLFYYIILGEGEWNILLLSFNDLIYGLVFSAAALYYLNKMKADRFDRLVVIAQILQTISFSLFFPYLFIRDYSKTTIFLIRIVLFITQAASLDLLIVPIIGKISKELPEGFESTGITVVISAYNMVAMINKELSSTILDYFKCKDGYYERSKSVYTLTLWWLVGLVAIAPFFLTWEKKRVKKKKKAKKNK